MTRNPITDWFGTVLDPVDLRAGLEASGLRGTRLVVHDDRLALEYAEGGPHDEAPSEALTWIRSQFSPLVAATLERVAEVEGHSVVDARTNEIRAMTFVELLDPEEFRDAAFWLAERLPRDRSAGATPEDPIGDERLASVIGHLRSTWTDVVALTGGAHVPLRWWRGPGTPFADGPDTPSSSSGTDAAVQRGSHRRSSERWFTTRETLLGSSALSRALRPHGMICCSKASLGELAGDRPWRGQPRAVQPSRSAPIAATNAECASNSVR